MYSDARCYVQSPGDDPFTRPPSGGPVKRNDKEYRWDRDTTRYEMYQVVDEAPPPKVVEEEPIIVRKPVVVSIHENAPCDKQTN